MPDKVTLTTITSGHGAVDILNNNFTAIANWINNNGLDITGTGTNTITADIDMNGNSLLNLLLTNTGWTWQGNWATATAYDTGDVVFVTTGTDATNGGSAYICVTAHTSGTFSTDYVTSGYWELVAQRGAQGASGSGSGDLIASNNLSDVANIATARTNLGIDGSSQNIATGDIADDAVTLAKIASGTDGELITWDASGDPAVVAVGTAGQILTSNGAGAAPTFQANSASPTVATKGTMETATNITDMVTPGRTQYHPGVAKAWASCVLGSGALTLEGSYNIASCSQSGQLITVTFTTAMTDANYAVICSSGDASESDRAGVDKGSKTTTGFVIHSNKGGSSGDTNSSGQVDFVVYGNQ